MCELLLVASLLLKRSCWCDIWWLFSLYSWLTLFSEVVFTSRSAAFWVEWSPCTQFDGRFLDKPVLNCFIFFCNLFRTCGFAAGSSATLTPSASLLMLCSATADVVAATAACCYAKQRCYDIIAAVTSCVHGHFTVSLVLVCASFQKDRSHWSHLNLRHWHTPGGSTDRLQLWCRSQLLNLFER